MPTTPTARPSRRRPADSPPLTRSRAPALGGALAVVLLLTACGGTEEEEAGVVSLTLAPSATSASSGADESATTGGDSEAELVAYAECLRGQGLDVPDPTVDAEGNLSLGGPGAGGGAGDPAALPDAEAFEAAAEVCGDLPEGAVAGLEEVDSPEFADAALAFAECMRAEGIDVADPDLSGGLTPGEGGEAGPFGDLDMEDPAVQAALETCQDVFGDAGPGQP